MANVDGVSKSPVVRFLAYRQHEAARVEASNAMMAFLAGANMSAHLLQLTSGSKHLLGEVFPQVPHIGRFNLTSDAARAILLDAESHLGGMAVPYALAIHEDFLRTCLDLLRRAGLCTGRDTRPSMKEIHGKIEQATGQPFDAVSMAQFQVMRCLRNAIVHANGRAGTELFAEFLPRWTPEVERGWVKIAKRSPLELTDDERVDLRHGELILTLAVTRKLARQANAMLVTALPRDLWITLLIEDVMAAGGLAGNHAVRAKKVRGIARMYFGPVAFSKAEIMTALDRVAESEKAGALSC
jgi:hypothetical protein